MIVFQIVVVFDLLLILWGLDKISHTLREIKHEMGRTVPVDPVRGGTGVGDRGEHLPGSAD